jgi:hypothetical protein
MTNQSSCEIISVEFYARSGVVNGLLSCPSGARLLDILNGVGFLEKKIKGEFIEFANATISNTGVMEKSSEYFRKTALQLVAISDTNLGRGFGASGNRSTYPFVQKRQVWVSLQLPDYSLMGTIHLDQRQSTQDLLNEDTQFLPLTEVTIAREYHLYGTRPFVAINKQHIISSREEPLGVAPNITSSIPAST